MKIFSTVDIKEIGCFKVEVPGGKIIAVDERHAKLALIHLGRPDAQITGSEDPISGNMFNVRKIQWDSLLMVSKIQHN